MKTNVLFIIVNQAKADDFKLAATEVSAKYPFRIQLVSAFSSELKCGEDAFAVCVDGGCGILKEIAHSLRGFVEREVTILLENCAAPLDGELVRLVKFEQPQTNDDVQDALAQSYGQVDCCVACKGAIFVYAKGRQITTFLIGKNQPNQHFWQKNVSKAFEGTVYKPVFKDAWLFVV